MEQELEKLKLLLEMQTETINKQQSEIEHLKDVLFEIANAWDAQTDNVKVSPVFRNKMINLRRFLEND